MSTFNRFCSATKRTFKKITDKTEQLFDSAANSIKIKNLEMKIDEQYENLGRIIYRDLHTEEDLEEEKLQVIAAIDALFDRISELKNPPAAETEDETADTVTDEAAPTDDSTDEAAEATDDTKTDTDAK